MAKLIGEKVILREYIKEDIPLMSKLYNSNSYSLYYAPYKLKVYSLEDIIAIYNFILKNNGNSNYYFVVSNLKGIFLGEIAIKKINFISRVAQLSIVLNEEHIGRGYGREAFSLILKFAFANLNLHKLELLVFSNNERALKFYSKFNFKVEGEREENVFINGSYYNTVYLGLLKKDFKL